MADVQLVIEVTKAFEEFINNWDYSIQLVIGAYGSGKSYAVVQKLILKLLQETHKVLVVRETYESIKESCFDLFKEQLEEMNILSKDPRDIENGYVIYRDVGMQYKFPNGSRVIFRGLDKVGRMKSLNAVSIVWIEECTQIKESAFNELLGRIRPKNGRAYFILSCNPDSQENWVYKRFFARTIDGERIVVLDDEILYEKKTVVKNGVYYHHSTGDDNPHLGKDYIKRLDDIANYDKDLHRVARHGRFGVNGKLVLPQFEIATDAQEFRDSIASISQRYHFTGFDFGFETSYNAVIRMVVDSERQYLYIYDEIYKNHVTDTEFIREPKMHKLLLYQRQMREHGIRFNPIVADSSAPKDIKFYRDEGYFIRACENRGMGANNKGTRIQNTKKIKRFKKIICSPACPNTIRELQTLTYKKDRNGELVYDDFNIDPHTFSAIWYGLDRYTVADPKDEKRHSYR